MKEKKDEETACRENTWMKFLTMAAIFIGTSSASTGMGVADWIGMGSNQSQLNSIGRRF